jgi:uncharacterized protein
MSKSESFVEMSFDPPVRGFIHRPECANGNGIVLTHGAGANCQTLLLTDLAEAFARAGLTALRVDLPFRQARAFGPPRPGDAVRDRDGLANSVNALRKQTSGRVFLGGHSYGGRQATILAASNSELVNGLLLLSYPLHPPRQPSQLRTQHLPNLRTPAMFVHGTRDPFGSIEEMEAALKLVPGKHTLMTVEGAGHDLGFKGKAKKEDLPNRVLAEFLNFSGLS